MSISPTSGEEITLTQAKDFVKAFRTKFPDQIKGAFIGIENVERILKQESCIGIRIYNGYDDNENKMNYVLVGVNEKEEDMTDGILMERLIPCPNYCNTSSVLFNV